ncbi:substrate-specific activator of APC-dependent proteolysis [Coemansia sp. RSA 485]|nr:substrate-specific activator of APC-dependent proteolysis [Coemansia sp. RSA 485]
MHASRISSSFTYLFSLLFGMLDQEFSRRLRSAPTKEPLEGTARKTSVASETETNSTAAQNRSQPLRNNRRSKRSTRQNDGAVETKQTETQASHAVDSKRCTRATSRTKTGSDDALTLDQRIQAATQQKAPVASGRTQSKARSRSRAGSNSPTRLPRPRESVDLEAERIMTRSMARRLRAQESKVGTGLSVKERLLQLGGRSPTRNTCSEYEERDDDKEEPESVIELQQLPSPSASVSPENHGRHVRRSPQFNYDRFIPAHSGLDMRMYEHSPRAASPAFTRTTMHIEHTAQIDEANRTYDALLRSELLNDRAAVDDFDSTRRMHAVSPTPQRQAQKQASRRELQMLSSSPRILPSLIPWTGSSSGGASSRPNTPPPPRTMSPARGLPVFAYRSPRKAPLSSGMNGSPPPITALRSAFGQASASHDVYQASAVGPGARRLLGSRPTPRRVARDPIKVLDAPGIRDDYYLNLMDWSASNRVAVALGSEVYVWDAQSSATSRLCDVGESDWVSSVRWDSNGGQLAVGLASGAVQLWDANRGRRLRTFASHSRRVGVLDWNGAVVSSGSRDKRINNHDSRLRQGALISTYYGHSQEVCGLRWSPDRTQLASGGNDNLLLLWDTRYTSLDARAHASHPDIAPAARVFRRPLFRLDAHTAAVKALAWSPTQPALLASGGGTDDRCIRLWNTHTGSQISAHDTKSQVCNLAWSPDGSELLSTHGYSQNHVIVWRYPQMAPIALLSGHTKRVLYLAQSPDGSTIATAAGDETIRFWDVFPRSAPVPALPQMPVAALGHLPGGIARGLALTAPGTVVLDDLAHNRDAHHYDGDDVSALNRALRPNGLYCKDIAGDGNCLFRSLADQTDGTPDTHSKLRQAVCDYMERHVDEFAPFMDETCSLPDYINNMRHLGTYGGNMELVAFARNFRVDIKVYQTGSVFVISGAPSNMPNDQLRSMPTVHVAYHSYEHYSSVRNIGGPHTGLPEIKEGVQMYRFFEPLLDFDGLPKVIGRVDATFLHTRNAVVPKAVAISMANPPIPASFKDINGALVPDRHNHDVLDDCDDILTDIEKIVTSSTGVTNIRLIRSLLKTHNGDSGHVIELLIQWMADSSDSAWFLADGPADYNGPQQLNDHMPKEQALVAVDTTAAAAATFADDESTVVDDNEDITEKIIQCLTEPAHSLNAPVDGNADTDDKKQHKHKKGAARQKKAESKKRQKEMAKIKKRMAAREFHAGLDSAKTPSTNNNDGGGEIDLTKRMEHIYI